MPTVILYHALQLTMISIRLHSVFIHTFSAELLACFVVEMALESTVQMQQNDGNRTPEKPVDREKVKNDTACARNPRIHVI